LGVDLRAVLGFDNLSPVQEVGDLRSEGLLRFGASAIHAAGEGLWLKRTTPQENQPGAPDGEHRSITSAGRFSPLGPRGIGYASKTRDAPVSASRHAFPLPSPGVFDGDVATFRGLVETRASA
jgi:hypothetical protein